MSTCVRFLECVSVAGHSLVYSSPTLSCDDTEYLVWRAVIFLFIAIDVVGIPIAILAITLLNRQRIVSNDASFKSRFGVLWEAFGPHACWWQAVIVVRRTALVTADTALLMFPSSRFMAFTYVNFAALMAQLVVQPYTVHLHNHLESFSLICLVLLSVMLTAFHDTINDILRWVLAAFIAGPALVILCVVVRRCCAKRGDGQLDRSSTSDEALGLSDNDSSGYVDMSDYWR